MRKTQTDTPHHPDHPNFISIADIEIIERRLYEARATAHLLMNSCSGAHSSLQDGSEYLNYELFFEGLTRLAQELQVYLDELQVNVSDDRVRVVKKHLSEEALRELQQRWATTQQRCAEDLRLLTPPLV